MDSDETLLKNMQEAKGIKPSSFETYKRLLNYVNIMCKNSGFLYFLTNPDNVYKRMLVKYPGPTATRGNLITAITKLYSTNPYLLDNFMPKYVKWKEHLKNERNVERDRYFSNEPSEKQEQNIVDYKDVQNLYNEMKGKDFQDNLENLQFLLLSIMINLRPKRSDLGSVLIYQNSPKNDIGNYIVLNGSPQLVVNDYKMAHKRGPIIEDISDVLQNDIYNSLKHFPRKYLFVDKNGKPYNNNAYGQFVQRTFKKYFNKATGVSLWRHIHITEKINPLTLQYGDMLKEANLMGHSTNQQAVYLWKNRKKIDE